MKRINLIGPLCGFLVSMLLSSMMLVAPASANEECTTPTQVVCPVVPETNYNGNSNVRPTIKVLVCFSDDDHRIITRPDGTNEWVVHLRYARGSFERIATEHNSQCRTQWVTTGTKVAVYVTCPEYTGWVSTPAISSDGTYVMERVGGAGWSYTPV